MVQRQAPQNAQILLIQCGAPVTGSDKKVPVVRNEMLYRKIEPLRRGAEW